MLKGRNVRIRMQRQFLEQRQWVFIGKVEGMSETWIAIMGKGIVILPGKTHPVEIDDEARPMVIPRDNIANIRILPDDFDLDDIQVRFKGNRTAIKVRGAPDTWISELGEG